MPILLTAILSLVGLLILHEASHFGVAKLFGLRVDEFGLGYPPRLIGKKIKNTLYSINLIPFGAFVDIPEQELRKASFGKRFLVLAAGVISFWVFAFILFSGVFMMGAPVQISDQAENPSARVQILAVAENSPAEEAGLKAGDLILQLGEGREVSRVEEVQEFTMSHKGEEVDIIVQRGEREIGFRARPRISPPEGEGSLGIALGRVVVKRWSFVQAVRMGCEETVNLTLLIVKELGRGVVSLFTDQESQIQVMGPVGIMGIFVQMGRLGVAYFMRTMAIISLNLAVLNFLPFLPITDGGKILFLGLEKVWKKPFNEETEEKINRFFFVFLLLLMFLITIRDIKGIL